jgi:hypothetical protein
MILDESFRAGSLPVLTSLSICLVLTLKSWGRAPVLSVRLLNAFQRTIWHAQAWRNPSVSLAIVWQEASDCLHVAFVDTTFCSAAPDKGRQVSCP